MQERPWFLPCATRAVEDLLINWSGNASKNYPAVVAISFFTLILGTQRKLAVPRSSTRPLPTV